MLFDPPALDGVKLSPDGTRLSLVTANEGEQHVVALNIADMKPLPVVRLGLSRLSNLWWTSDRRILLLLDEPDQSRIFKSIDLVSGQVAVHHLGGRSWWLIHELPDKPDVVLIGSHSFGSHGYELRLLDLKSNRARTVEKNPGQVTEWLIDASGKVTAAVEMTSVQYSLLHKAAPDARWTSKPYGTPEEPRFSFLGVHPDQRRLLALDYTSDTSQLVAVDPATLETEVVFAPADFDPYSLETWGAVGGVPKSLVYSGRPDSRRHLSPDSAALLPEIDRAMPDTLNSVHSSSRDGRRLVILSFSEQNPGRYHLWDRNSGRLVPLGSRLDGIEAASLGRGRAFSFVATDGLAIHGNFIAPPGPSHPAPLVLLMEDDVFSTREPTSFHVLRQAFATRGYAVATIDYRGTKGYGHTFAKKGRQQITGRIPLDLAEGVQWLGRQGWIDPQRVIIMGSYEAGWVAMHSLVRTQGTYAGWINFGTGIGHDLDIQTDKPAHAMADWDYWQYRLDLKASGIDQADSPVKLLSAISVPAFHHYFELDIGTLIAGGEHVRRDIRNNKRDAVVVARRSGDTIQDNRTRQLAVYEQLFDFLAERFPTTQNPRPTTAGGRN